MKSVAAAQPRSAPAFEVNEWLEGRLDERTADAKRFSRTYSMATQRTVEAYALAKMRGSQEPTHEVEQGRQ